MRYHRQKRRDGGRLRLYAERHASDSATLIIGKIGERLVAAVAMRCVVVRRLAD